MKLPDGWEMHSLGELFSSRKEKGIEGSPTLSVTINDGLVDRSSIERKTDTNLSPQEHLLIRKGDLAYNMMRMWQGASGLADYDGLVSPAYVVLSPTNRIDSKFAFYWFKSPRMIYLFWAYSYGLTGDRLRLYFKDFTKINNIIPPLPEQKAIADLLSTWDEAIEKTERLIQVKEKQFKWMLHELINGSSVNGDEWEKVKLGHLFGKEIIVEKGKAQTKEAVCSGKVPVVAGGQTYAYYTNDATHRMPTITISASGANAGFVWYHDYPMWASDCNVLYSKKGSTLFLYYALKSLQNHIYALQSGGAQPHVYSKDLKNLKIPLPSLEEQKQIDDTLSTAQHEIDLLKQLAEKYKTQKRGLMQKMLTGEWRMKDEIISKYMET